MAIMATCRSFIFYGDFHAKTYFSASQHRSADAGRPGPGRLHHHHHRRQKRLVVGGEYGKGVLHAGSQTVDYYSVASVSVGFQAGAQSKAVVLLFMTREALDKFRNSKGWTASATPPTGFPTISRSDRGRACDRSRSTPHGSSG